MSRKRKLFLFAGSRHLAIDFVGLLSSTYLRGMSSFLDAAGGRSTLSSTSIVDSLEESAEEADYEPYLADYIVVVTAWLSLVICLWLLVGLYGVTIGQKHSSTAARSPNDGSSSRIADKHVPAVSPSSSRARALSKSKPKTVGFDEAMM